MQKYQALLFDTTLTAAVTWVFTTRGAKPPEDSCVEWFGLLCFPSGARPVEEEGPEAAHTGGPAEKIVTHTPKIPIWYLAKVRSVILEAFSPGKPRPPNLTCDRLKRSLFLSRAVDRCGLRPGGGVGGRRIASHETRARAPRLAFCITGLPSARAWSG